jgi:CheY-like chemotaxis protein
MTGYGQSSDRARSKAAGFEHHLVKPAEFPEIAAILAEAARRAASR